MLPPRIAQAFGLTKPSAICTTVTISRQASGAILGRISPERPDEKIWPQVFHDARVARQWAAGVSIIHGLPVVDQL